MASSAGKAQPQRASTFHLMMMISHGPDLSHLGRTWPVVGLLPL